MKFFSNYLVDRKTKYLWNNFSSPFYNIDIGVGQGSALSPILFALYLSSIFYILENYLKNLKIPISFLSFVNDGLFISQNKSISVSNVNLFYSYNVISSLLTKFSLVMEHNKTNVFYFSKLHGAFNSPPLDLFPLGELYLLLKTICKYLDFIFDHKLLFWDYINFYVNKAILTVKYMKMLGNSTRSLISLQKQCLYRCCALPIALYGFQLWYYNKASLHYPLNILNKMQHRAAIWITRAFCTLLTDSIKAIAELIPIYLHLKKLYDRFLLRGFSLSLNHIIKLFITHDNPQSLSYHQTLLAKLTSKQLLCLKSPLIDMDNRCNKFFSSFSLLDMEFFLENCLCNNFPNHVFFHPKSQDIKVQIWKLNNVVITFSSDHLLYIFIFIFDDEEAHDCSHMIYHMMWYHRLKVD